MMNKKNIIVALIVIGIMYYLYTLNSVNVAPKLKGGSSDLSTRGSTNKNPLNIKKGGKTDWLGTKGYDSYGHAIFTTYQYGIRAALVDIRGKINRGINTVDKLVRIWAEANTGNYSNYIVKESKLTHDGILKFDKSTMRELTFYMGIWESKYYISDGEFNGAWNLV